MINRVLFCLWVVWAVYRLANPPPKDLIDACVELSGDNRWRAACVNALWFRRHSLLGAVLLLATVGRVVWQLGIQKVD